LRLPFREILDRQQLVTNLDRVVGGCREEIQLVALPDALRRERCEAFLRSREALTERAPLPAGDYRHQGSEDPLTGAKRLPSAKQITGAASAAGWTGSPCLTSGHGCRSRRDLAGRLRNVLFRLSPAQERLPALRDEHDHEPQ